MESRHNVSFNNVVFVFHGIFFFLTCVCFISAQSTKPQCAESINVNSEVGRIQSPGYPYPYKSGCEWTYTINVGEYGSEIEIIMETFDIDQAAGDNLFVATGTIEDNRNWYKIEKTDLEVYVRSPAILRFVTTQHLINTHIGFSIVFRKHDDIDNFGTTTEKISTQTSTPNPCYNNWLLIQLKGLSMSEFEKKKEAFQKVMANVTAIYSGELSLNVSKILHNMGYDKLILINSVDNCKKCFIYKDNCIQVNISINSNNIGFQEINQIWNLYKDCYLFRSIGIEEHTNSDYQMDGLIMAWLVASILLAITVVALLVVLIRNKRMFAYVSWLHVRTDSKDQNIWSQTNNSHGSKEPPYLPSYSDYMRDTIIKSRTARSDGSVNDEIDFDSMLYSLETYKPDRRGSMRYVQPNVHHHIQPLPVTNINLPRGEHQHEKLRRYSTKEFF